MNTTTLLSLLMCAALAYGTTGHCMTKQAPTKNNQQNQKWNDPLEEALTQEQPDFTAALQAIKDQGGIDAIDQFTGTTLLLNAIGGLNPRMDVAGFLIDHGANVNIPCRTRGHSPLIWAVMHKNSDITKKLIEKGANVRHANKQGNTPLHFALSDNIAQILIDSGANINAQNNAKETPLHTSAKKGSVEVTKALLRAGADMSIKDTSGFSVLDYDYNNDAAKFIKQFATDLNSFLIDPTSEKFFARDETITDNGMLMLAHLYHGLLNPGYPKKLEQARVKFIESGEGREFNQAINDFYTKDYNDQYRKTYDKVKQQLSLFKMAQAGKLTNMNIKIK